MYIVWLHTSALEGWHPSHELETLESCFDYLRDHNYGSEYKITKTVKVNFEEVE